MKGRARIRRGHRPQRWTACLGSLPRLRLARAAARPDALGRIRARGAARSCRRTPRCCRSSARHGGTTAPRLAARRHRNSRRRQRTARTIGCRAGQERSVRHARASSRSWSISRMRSRRSRAGTRHEVEPRCELAPPSGCTPRGQWPKRRARHAQRGAPRGVLRREYGCVDVGGGGGGGGTSWQIYRARLPAPLLS